MSRKVLATDLVQSFKAVRDDGGVYPAAGDVADFVIGQGIIVMTVPGGVPPKTLFDAIEDLYIQVGIPGSTDPASLENRVTTLAGKLPLAVINGGTGITAYTAGNYINALNATTLQQRTPAQVRSDLGVTTCSSGTYTPTYTNVTNVTSTTLRGDAQWMRVGNVVTVSGQVAVVTTAAANALTEVGISLPVASNFTANNQAGGSFVAQFTGQFPAGFAYADIANDRVGLRFAAPSIGSFEFWYNFTYLVA